MKVIIGIPAFNEEKNIGAIVAKLKAKYDHVIVCDDGSTDNSLNYIREHTKEWKNCKIFWRKKKNKAANYNFEYWWNCKYHIYLWKL